MDEAVAWTCPCGKKRKRSNRDINGGYMSFVLNERQRAILIEDFKWSCLSWYGCTQIDVPQKNLQHNFIGRQEVGKRIIDWTSLGEKSIKAFRQIKDELDKTEIEACQRFHGCMPPLRGLYPPTDEVKEFIEENGYE
jgi:hypothetical protein